MKNPIWKRRLLISNLGVLSFILLFAFSLTHPVSTQANPGSRGHDQLQRQFKRVPLVTEEAQRNGVHLGGEGAQWMRDIEWSPADPNFLLAAIDVGGIYRSLDGGQHWQTTMTGLNSRGVNTVAFDPNNGKRALIVAGNSTDFDLGKQPHGLYLTTDKAASWQQVLPMSAGQDDRDSLTYDPSSYDPAKGYCTVAYFLSKFDGLYKTTDGGLTWAKINEGFSGLRVATHPTKGYVYITSDQNPDGTTPDGLYRSTDGGVTFTRLVEGRIFGLDVSAAAPDNVWISRLDGVLVSTDSGETFQNTGMTGFPEGCCTEPLQDVTVSPIDPNYLSTWIGLPNWDFRRYYSTDGGKTWGQSDYGASGVEGENRFVKNSIIPFNVRNGTWAYSPVKANVVVSISGDWVSKSTDGGAHYSWFNQGNNGIFVPTFNFSSFYPRNVVMASKDYNPFYSKNGGHSWSYVTDKQGVGFDWGGYTYGGFALDHEVMWLADDERIDSQGDPVLKVTIDGGKTWTKALYNGEPIRPATNANKYRLVGSNDPTDPKIGFSGGWRTTDRGRTWEPMGIDNVYTYNPTGQKELYGKKDSDIVVSYDHGTTWTSVGTIPGGFVDLAYDHLHDRFYLASEDRPKMFEDGQVSDVAIPLDQYGTTRTQTIAVDPVNPNIVYVGNNRDLWTSSNSIVRSVNGGQTWENITVQTPLQSASPWTTTGPREVWWIRVQPHTREAWMATSCFGIWKIAAP